MKKRIALLDNDCVVTNIVICTQCPSNGIDVTNDNTASIGKKYMAGCFVDRKKTLQEIQDIRRKEYPPLEDLADAIYWQSNGDNSKMEEYLRLCEEVKLRYPLP